MSNILDTIKVASGVIAGIDSTKDRVALLDLVSQTHLLIDENQDLKRQNARLAEQLARRKALERIKGAYYIIESDGSKTGPVCPVCYERDGIPSILRSTDEGAECASCGREYPGVQASVRSRGCEIY